jgi:hypothetical protein
MAYELVDRRHENATPVVSQVRSGRGGGPRAIPGQGLWTPDVPGPISRWGARRGVSAGSRSRDLPKPRTRSVAIGRSECQTWIVRPGPVAEPSVSVRSGTLVGPRDDTLGGVAPGLPAGGKGTRAEERERSDDRQQPAAARAIGRPIPRRPPVAGRSGCHRVPRSARAWTGGTDGRAIGLRRRSPAPPRPKQVPRTCSHRRSRRARQTLPAAAGGSLSECGDGDGVSGSGVGLSAMGGLGVAENGRGLRRCASLHGELDIHGPHVHRRVPHPPGERVLPAREVRSDDGQALGRSRPWSCAQALMTVPSRSARPSARSDAPSLAVP